MFVLWGSMTGDKHIQGFRMIRTRSSFLFPGTCVPGGTSLRCHCKQGWSGPRSVFAVNHLNGFFSFCALVVDADVVVVVEQVRTQRGVSSSNVLTVVDIFAVDALVLLSTGPSLHLSQDDVHKGKY